MDKTVLIFVPSFVLGIILKNLPEVSHDDPIGIYTILIGAAEIWLTLHYTVAIITLVILGIMYLNKRIKPKHFAPLSFGAGFLAGTTTHELVDMLYQLIT